MSVLDKITNAFREYGTVLATDYEGDVWTIVGVHMSSASCCAFLRRGKQVLHCDVADLEVIDSGEIFINALQPDQKYEVIEGLAGDFIYELNALDAQASQLRCRLSIIENNDDDTGNLAYREHYKIKLKKPRNWG